MDSAREREPATAQILFAAIAAAQQKYANEAVQRGMNQVPRSLQAALSVERRCGG